MQNLPEGPYLFQGDLCITDFLMSINNGLHPTSVRDVRFGVWMLHPSILFRNCV